MIDEIYIALMATGLASLVWFGRANRGLRATQRELRAGLERRHVELAVLQSLTRELATSRTLDQILERVDRECAKLFRPDEILIALLDPTTAAVRPVRRRRPRERPRPDGRSLEGPLLATVIAEGRTIARTLEPPSDDRDLQSEGMRSLLAAPLISEERATGVLCVQSRAAERWGRHDLAALDCIAQMMSLAIEGTLQSRRAAVDSLTGLLRRERFFERLEEEHGRISRYGGDFCILMIDLDGFKAINDLHGHLAGDGYLRRLGQTIHGRLRGADVGARYGGDEFALMLPQTDLAGGRAIAERLRRAVSELTVEIDGRQLRTTASIGLASFAEHDSGDLHGLLQKADQALYMAKRAGRDRVIPWAA